MLWILAEHNIETTVYAYNTNFSPHIVDKVVVEHILCIPSYPFWDSISTSPGFTIHIRKKLCGGHDWLSATKFVYNVGTQKMIVRYAIANHFHHLIDIVYSCRDYWWWEQTSAYYRTWIIILEEQHNTKIDTSGLDKYIFLRWWCILLEWMNGI